MNNNKKYYVIEFILMYLMLFPSTYMYLHTLNYAILSHGKYARARQFVKTRLWKHE